MITFVTHYIDLSPEMIKHIQLARASYTSKQLYLVKNPEGIINTLYESIKTFHPKSSLIVLTDENSQIELDPAIKLVRLPRKTNFVDFECLQAKVTFLRKTPPKTNVIFLEWDMIVQDNLEHIFEDKSDLILTFRNILPMPFNDGFIGVKRGGFERVCRFFDMILKRYNHFTREKYKYWYGLQLIFKSLFRNIFLTIKPVKVKHMGLNYKDLKIRFLDGKIYNYNPIAERAKRISKSKKVVHFSKRKKLGMLGYWKAFCLVRSRSEKK